MDFERKDHEYDTNLQPESIQDLEQTILPRVHPMSECFDDEISIVIADDVIDCCNLDACKDQCGLRPKNFGVDFDDLKSTSNALYEHPNDLELQLKNRDTVLHHLNSLDYGGFEDNVYPTCAKPEYALKPIRKHASKGIADWIHQEGDVDDLYQHPGVLKLRTKGYASILQDLKNLDNIDIQDDTSKASIDRNGQISKQILETTVDHYVNGFEEAPSIDYLYEHSCVLQLEEESGNLALDNFKKLNHCSCQEQCSGVLHLEEEYDKYVLDELVKLHRQDHQEDYEMQTKGPKIDSHALEAIIVEPIIARKNSGADILEAARILIEKSNNVNSHSLVDEKVLGMSQLRGQLHETEGDLDTLTKSLRDYLEPRVDAISSPLYAKLCATHTSLCKLGATDKQLREMEALSLELESKTSLAEGKNEEIPELNKFMMDYCEFLENYKEGFLKLYENETMHSFEDLNQGVANSGLKFIREQGIGTQNDSISPKLPSKFQGLLSPFEGLMDTSPN